MDMFKMIQRMTEIENEEKKKQLNESAIAECGESGMMPPAENPGNPVTMSVTLNASGKEHVDDLMAMMKAAGLEKAAPVGPSMMPMRQDMDRLGAIVRQGDMEEEGLDEYDNEPEETYMSQPKGGGINREKHAYLDAEDGDNAMAVESDDEDDDDKEDEMRESIRSSLMKALAEKKAKPDFLDMDKDGDKKEPMKKAIKDKGGKAKKGKVPPQFQKKTNESPIKFPRKDVMQAYQIFAKQMKQGSLGAEAEDLVMDFAINKLGYSPEDADMLAQRVAIKHIDAVGEAEVQAPSHEMSDVARKAASMAQVIKRKINSGDEMDDRDYNQMAELGAVLSRVGTSFGPKSMKDVLAHMVDYTDARNQEGHKYPEMNVDRFKELLAMAKSTNEEGFIDRVKSLPKRIKQAQSDAKMKKHLNKVAGDTLKGMEPKELKPYYDAMRDKKKK